MNELESLNVKFCCRRKLENVVSLYAIQPERMIAKLYDQNRPYFGHPQLS